MRFRIWQFGLRTLLAVILLAALGIAWWRERQNSAELRDLRNGVRSLQEDVKREENFRLVLSALDLKQPLHREALEVMRQMNDEGLKRQGVIVHPLRFEPDEWRLIDLGFGYIDFAGFCESTIVLMHDDKIVDILVRAPKETNDFHVVELSVTAGEDGETATLLSYDRWAGMYWHEWPLPKVTYRVTRKGFEELPVQEATQSAAPE